jgi:magnesium chelatase subunit H
MNVVIITLDSHLRSATERASKPLAKAIKGLKLSLHAAADWADNESSLLQVATLSSSQCW